MDAKLYYKAPTQCVFDEMKKKCIELWREVDTDNDKYGYATEKINRIKDIGNTGDNFMYMVAMFDIENQTKLASRLSAEAKKAVSDRLVAGGQPDEYNRFK